MGLTGKPRKELNLFDLDVKLTVVQLKALTLVPGHLVMQSELVAWCRLHGFGRDKSIASLKLLEKKKLIYREYWKGGVSIFDVPIRSAEYTEVGYKIDSFGKEFLAIFERFGIPDGSILGRGGK